MESFDKQYQTRANGPLTPAVRARLQRFRDDGVTLKDMGAALEISGAFVGKLLADPPANISTNRVRGLIKTLERHEQLAGYVPKAEPESRDSPSKKWSPEQMSIEQLIGAILDKGYDVSVGRRATR